MMKLVLALLTIVLLPDMALAQNPTFTWKMVLKNFANHTQLVRPEQYPDRSTCELARAGMGYDQIRVLGLHCECVYVPTTFGHRKHR